MVDSVAHGFSKITAKQSKEVLGDLTIDLGRKTLGISDYKELMKSCLEVPGVEAVSPFIKGRVFYQDYNGVDQAAIIYGLSWPDEFKVSKLHEKMSENVKLPESLDRRLQNGAIFGSSHFGVLEGELVTFYGREGSITVEPRGSFKTGIAEMDFSGVVVSLKTAQVLFGASEFMPEVYKNMATGVRIKVKKGFILEEVQVALFKKIALHSVGAELNIWTYRDLNSIEIKAMESYEKIIKIILFVMLLMMTTAVFIPVQSMVYEKHKDIGILRALGGSKTFVFNIFLIIGAMLGAFSTLFGLPLGLILTKYLNDILAFLDYNPFPEDVFYIDQLPTNLHVEGIVSIILFINLVAILASILPAFRAARLTPIKTLRSME